MLPIKICFSFLNLFFLRISAYITFIEPRNPHPDGPKTFGSPWPKPQTQESQPDVLCYDQNTFKWKSNAMNCDVIRQALKRYRKLIWIDHPHRTVCKNTQNELSHIMVQVMNFSEHQCAYPRHMDDESYILHVALSGRVHLMTNTIWGALRGLETFSQLLHVVSETVVINATYIVDWPRFTYRGMMLDTARHFIPVSVLKNNLDAMAYNKMNVFHWHMVDDQSFPFESKVFPDLTRKGAYTPQEIYTQKDIHDVIIYARFRGIRVIPEFDTPGHTHAFGKAFPELLTSCYGLGSDRPNTPLDGVHASRENFDPTKNSTFTFLEKFFREVREVFPDEYIHLGMDEVYYDCWRSSPEIDEFMNRERLNHISEVEQYYSQRTVRLVEDIGYKYMAWQDPTDNGVEMAPSTIIEIWKEPNWEEKVRDVAELGYNMILSACWYLNYISYGEDWKKYYLCDPHLPLREQKHKEQMIGGEACMWSEYVDDTNLLARLWPRASAVAERLWSSSSTKDLKEAIYRLDEHRCRMLKRGIPAQPIINGYCPTDSWKEEENINVDVNFSSLHWYVLCAVFVLFFALLLRRFHHLLRKLLVRLLPRIILRT